MLGRQPWSFAGDSGRASVSQLFLDPCIHFNIDTNWFLLTFMILTTNWQAVYSNRWAMPLGGGPEGCLSKLRKEAKQRGLDPNIWFNNVEIIAADKIDRETVQYVSNIYKY